METMSLLCNCVKAKSKKKRSQFNRLASYWVHVQWLLIVFDCWHILYHLVSQYAVTTEKHRKESWGCIFAIGSPCRMMLVYLDTLLRCHNLVCAVATVVYWWMTSATLCITVIVDIRCSVYHSLQHMLYILMTPQRLRILTYLLLQQQLPSIIQWP